MNVRLIRNGTDSKSLIPQKKNNKNIKTFDENDFKDIDENDFIVFAKLILKDNILKANTDNCWQRQIKSDTMVKLNKFFENLPEEYIQFETIVKRKILLKYIVSNLSYGFNVKVNDDEMDRIYSIIEDLSRVDPRIKKY